MHSGCIGLMKWHFALFFTVNCYVKTRVRSIHNNLRLLYFGGTLTELSKNMGVPTFSNSFLLVRKG